MVRAYRGTRDGAIIGAEIDAIDMALSKHFSAARQHLCAFVLGLGGFRYQPFEVMLRPSMTTARNALAIWAREHDVGLTVNGCLNPMRCLPTRHDYMGVKQPHTTLRMHERTPMHEFQAMGWVSV